MPYGNWGGDGKEGARARALRAEVGAHNKTKNELAQKTARVARLEEELRQIRAQAAPCAPPKWERAPRSAATTPARGGISRLAPCVRGWEGG